MEKKRLPIVENGHFYPADNSIHGPIPLNTPDWFETLTHITSFIYREQDLYLTVRSETRRNNRYWYGYRRISGKLKKVYLGSSESLNSVTLASKAEQLLAISLPAESLSRQRAQSTSLPNSTPAADPSSNALTNNAPTNNEELLLAKLRIPAVPQRMVPRHRLTTRLKPPLQYIPDHIPDRHHQRRSKPLLTMLVAPSGYGKSTLLSEWVQTVPDLCIAWLSLEAEDNDLHQFWRYLIVSMQLALQHHVPTFGRAVNEQLHGVKLPPIRTIIRQLLNELQTCSHSMVLILDDFHFVNCPEIHQSLTYFIAHCPARLHVIISSRPPFSLPLGRLHTQCDITEIGYDELKLTGAETTALLNQHGYEGQELVQQLLDKTGGWVTGINLALLVMAKDRPNMLRVLETEHRYFTDYFIENVLQQQPETRQQFLLQTALLDNFSVDLINNITDFPKLEIKQTLADLEEANLFLIPLNQESGWYRYHHLFAHALRRILTERNPQLIPVLHQRAARWYVASDNVSQGIHHFTAAECWTDIADLLQDRGVQLLQQGKLTQLIRWLRCLPETVLNNYPKLMSMYARVLMLTGDVMALEVWLNYLDLAAVDNPILQAEVQQIRAIVHGIEENPNSAEGDWWGSLDALTMSINLWTDGRLDDAVAAAQRAMTTGKAAGNDAIVLLAASNISFIYILTNRINQGLRFARETLTHYGLDESQIVAGKIQPNLAISPLLMAIGCAFYERDQLEKGLAYLQRAKKLCEQLGRIDYLTGAHLLIARALGAVQQTDAAFAEAKAGVELSSGVKQTFWPSQDTQAYQAWNWLHYGQRERALAWLNERAFDLTDPPTQPDIISYWVCAEILTMEGHYEQAIVMFEHLNALSNDGIRTEPGYKIGLVYAIALAGAGQQSVALDQMVHVLHIANREGMLRHFITWHMPASQLLITLLSKRTLDSTLLRSARSLVQRIEPASNGLASDHSLYRMNLSELTDREIEVLALLSQRLTNHQIAERLFVSKNTIKSHLGNIFRKLDVNRRELAVAQYKACLGHHDVRIGELTVDDAK